MSGSGKSLKKEYERQMKQTNYKHLNPEDFFFSFNVCKEKKMCFKKKN